MEAAYKGAGEIGFTIISLTVSLIAVFIPLLFMTGIVGRLFREFALTLTIAVVVSAVDLADADADDVRAAAATRLRRRAAPSWIARLVEAPHERACATSTDVTLDVVLRHQKATLIVTAATLSSPLLLYLAIPKGFLPDQDTGLPHRRDRDRAGRFASTRLQELQNQVEAVILRDPDVLGVVSVVGAGTTNRDAQCRPFRPHAEAEDRARRERHGHRARLTAAARQIPGIDTHLPGRAGHSDRHPQEPHAISVRAGRHRPGDVLAAGPTSCSAELKRRSALSRRLAPIFRRRHRRCSSRWTA